MTREERFRHAKREALAFRIWGYCEPKGWDCTASEVAEALGVSWQRVVATLKFKGWARRIRSGVTDRGGGWSAPRAIGPSFEISTGERLL